MSDLQDLIATNAVRAYNEGLERGIASEQERIIAVLETKHNCTDDDFICICVYGDVIRLIKGE